MASKAEPYALAIAEHTTRSSWLYEEIQRGRTNYKEAKQGKETIVHLVEMAETDVRRYMEFSFQSAVLAVP